jgi:tetratricopeptide (TPR) repeat protein
MRRLAQRLLLLAALLVGPGPLFGQTDIKTLFDNGKAAWDKGDLDTAISLFNQVIAIKPDLAAAYENRGALYFLKQQYALAQPDFDKAITLSPGWAPFYNARGRLNQEIGHCDLAIADFALALTLIHGPTMAASHAGRGECLVTQHNYSLGIADLTEAIRLEPNNPAWLEARARVYTDNIGTLDAALADYTKAISLKPDPHYYSNRGMIYVRKNDYDNAMVDFDQSIKTASPSDPLKRLYYINRAAVYTHRKEFDLAIADYDAAVSASYPGLPPSTEALARAGRCRARAEANRELDVALADCNAALEVLPHSTGLLENRAFAHLRKGSFDLAIADCETALAVKQDDAKAMYMRGIAKGRKGDRAGAKADIDKALALDPKADGNLKGYGYVP